MSHSGWYLCVAPSDTLRGSPPLLAEHDAQAQSPARRCAAGLRPARDGRFRLRGRGPPGDLLDPHGRGAHSAAGRRAACGRPVHASGRCGRRAASGPARIPALSQDRGALAELPAVLVLRRARLRGRRGRHSRDGQQRGSTDPVRVLGHRAAGRRSGHRLAVEATLVERQRGHVRHLVGRVQLDPDGAAQPSGAQGDHRRRCDGRPLPGRRALHRRHHSRRFVGDEPGPRQRTAWRPDYPCRRGVFSRPLRYAALDAHVQASATDGPFWDRASAKARYDRIRIPSFFDRRLVRRLSRQHSADARERAGAGQGDRRSLEPRVAARALSPARHRVATRGRALVRPMAEGRGHRDPQGTPLRGVRAPVAPARTVSREGTRAMALRGRLAHRAHPRATTLPAARSHAA